jgi:hypothetical protein
MVFNAPFNNISVSFIGGENWSTVVYDMMCLYAYKRLVIQNLCKRSRYLEENPVFLFFSKKKMKKKNSPQVCK